MKRLRYLIPALFVAALASGCLKGTENPVNPYPVGNFSGEFRLISKKASKTTIDTVKSNIKLTLNQDSAKFTITGDTTTIHAGSKGLYGISGSVIAFADKTLSTANQAKNAPVINGKAHLNGQYLFVFNGDILQMKTVVGDTVAFEYDLRRSN